MAARTASPASSTMKMALLSKLFTINQYRYVGSMEKGHYSGYGKGFYDNGSVFLEGPFKRGKLHGEKCKIFSDKGVLIFQGGMSNGIPNGHCKEFNQKGRVITMGNFARGKLIGGSSMNPKPRHHSQMRRVSTSGTLRNPDQYNSRLNPLVKTRQASPTKGERELTMNKKPSLVESTYFSNTDAFNPNRHTDAEHLRTEENHPKDRGSRNRSYTIDYGEALKESNPFALNKHISSEEISVINAKDEASFISN
jgi:hypothetical protein